MNMRQIALASVAALGMTAVPAKAPAQIDSKLIETIAAIFLADKLGIDSNTILSAALGSNASVFDMVPAFELQRYAPQQSAQSIYRMRQSGLGWGQVAQRLNMNPGQFNQLRNSGVLDPNNFWRNTTQAQFALTPSQVNNLRARGLTWRDITNAAVVARESGANLYQVADKYRRYRSWNTVAAGYGLGGSQIANRVASWRTSRTMPVQWRTVSVRPATQWRVTNSKTWRAQPIKSTTSKAHKAKKAKKSHGKGKAKGHGKH
jgi:hypothetical protein